MENLVTGLLKKQMTDQLYGQAANKLGLKGEQSQSLINNTLPTLLGGLAKNTQNKKGAESLFGALKNNKHNGDILGSDTDFFTSVNLDEGDKILKHILGDTREDIAEALANESGTSPSQATQALKALSPMVMGALGKAVQSKKLNADQVGTILQLALKEKDFGKVAHRIATLMWDKDGDGKYKDDLFEMGKRWVAKLLKNKK